MRRDSVIKKLLKIFLFIFSIYFYYALIHIKKKEEGKFRLFRPVPANMT